MEPPSYVEPASYAIDSRRWAPHAVRRAWGQLEAQVPEPWLPRDPILGCGGSGCVYATSDDDVVVKVTNDDTEIEFASAFAGQLSSICVMYHRAFKTLDVQDGRPVWILWRESANRVGELEDVLGGAVGSHIYQVTKAGQSAYGQARRVNRAGARVASAERQLDADLRAYVAACDALARQGDAVQLRPLGAGLGAAFQRFGVVFGDFRVDNLGLVRRQDGGHWVVIDPGNIAVVAR